MTRLSPEMIKLQLDTIKLLFPDLIDDEDAWNITIESETDLYEYLRQIERKRQDSVAMANAVDEVIENLKQRRVRFERRDEVVRNLMFRIMESAQLKKAELPECTISIRAGVPKIIITDELALPDELCRFKREPDKTKIKQALSDGPVTGATLSNIEPILSIRTK